ncbi:protein-tyrosine-phosphatase [Mesonia sp. MT50]|uniref:Protein-tyrosine-phosphatase n=1 Tax=Mesonia profundi TaxID=3070998 RepID=A0ABU1A168_9FLAO|nr:protein-tyrosine-phosphatase [Mesonia profundi]MDQ7917452.1 protein-tyrosine-phosphatase [Mesonia profundi]
MKDLLFPNLITYINQLAVEDLPQERKTVLNTLTEFIQKKTDKKEVCNLNFICTHNSRRSHLCQIWAQSMASFFDFSNVFIYSGGTEVTAMHPQIVYILRDVGFSLNSLSKGENVVYRVGYGKNLPNIMGFSKLFNDEFNPQSQFCAIMTCSQAAETCPFIPGAEKRIALTYEDPKEFDGLPNAFEKYKERSEQIAVEMKYVFSQIELKK